VFVKVNYIAIKIIRRKEKCANKFSLVPSKIIFICARISTSLIIMLMDTKKYDDDNQKQIGRIFNNAVYLIFFPLLITQQNLILSENMVLQKIRLVNEGLHICP